jgi:hypothetical protein
MNAGTFELGRSKFTPANCVEPVLVRENVKVWLPPTPTRRVTTTDAGFATSTLGGGGGAVAVTPTTSVLGLFATPVAPEMIGIVA